MPKPKKSGNGFMNFAMEWKEINGRNLSIGEVTARAGKVWENMSMEQREQYKQKPKMDKGNKPKESRKLTCTGELVSAVEAERKEAEDQERQMKRSIEVTVRDSVNKSELDSHNFYFVMVNYFAKALNTNMYVPAEISVSEFSLKNGVSRKYHSLINPGNVIYGHQYEAQTHSNLTHELPVPPVALGCTDLDRIYLDVVEFIRDKSTGELPPVYTIADSIPIVSSVLEFLKPNRHWKDAVIDIEVYSIQYLFYIMKEAACAMGEVEKPKSIHVTDSYFERDFFEYNAGLGCQFHEDKDKTKYCTQSYVTRWGFMFCEYMCHDIAISLIPGRHVPVTVNMNAIVHARPGKTASATTTTKSDGAYAKTPPDEWKALNTSQHSSSRSSSSFTAEDFPTLGKKLKNKDKKPPPLSNQRKPTRNFDDRFNDDLSSDQNPWAMRNRPVPRAPNDSDFSIDFSHNEMTDNDEFQSVVSFGRGRGRGVYDDTFNTSYGSGFGRGRNFYS